MTAAQCMEKMIAFSGGNIHDIDHFIRVWTYAATIGRLEGLDPEEQLTVEIAAIVHDIACPLCREKYGRADGPHQETEGARMTAEFLADSGLPQAQRDRIALLVGRHHTLTGIDGQDLQILIEADYLANATENGYSRENAENFLRRIARTESGKRLIRSVLCP